MLGLATWPGRFESEDLGNVVWESGSIAETSGEAWRFGEVLFEWGDEGLESPLVELPDVKREEIFLTCLCNGVDMLTNGGRWEGRLEGVDAHRLGERYGDRGWGSDCCLLGVRNLDMGRGEVRGGFITGHRG
jgi:hypothetical protein